MAKHEKTTFSWDPPKDEWYKARITTLEKENLDLANKVKELQQALGNMELVMEHGETISSGINNELKEEIEELKAKNKALKEALVRAALREAGEVDE